jgi:hypothetical protein
MTFTSASNSSDELLQIARNAILAGHRATAARMVNRVLENDPANKDAWRLLAECMTDPESKRKCLVKAGDLPTHSDKAAFSSERYTTPPANRIELPPPPAAEEPDPVIISPRKYKPSPRAEYPASVPTQTKKNLPPRTARTRKTDPKKTRKSGGCGLWFILFLIFALLAAGGYLYFKPDLQFDQITSLLFPSTQNSEADPATDGLVPPQEIPAQTETPAPVPDANQPEEVPVSDLPVPLVEKVIKVGESVGGRPIEVFQFGSGETQRLIVAGMHGGNEYNTINLADEMIVYIHAHPEVIPADKTLFILRNLNPDGEARSHDVDGRTNNNGVDLNRNWDSHWKIDWNREGCWVYRPVTGGPFPASEPETQSLLNFVNDNHIDAIINYHSAALGIFPGGTPWGDSSVLLSQVLHEATGYSYPPINTGCEYTGMFTDWASDHGMAAVDIELTNHHDTDFDQNLKAMNVLLAWDPSAATAKGRPGEPGSNGEAPGECGALSQVQQTINDIVQEVYGTFMSRFEER